MFLVKWVEKGWIAEMRPYRRRVKLIGANQLQDLTTQVAVEFKGKTAGKKELEVDDSL
jgi:hypothetical protein